MLDRLLGDELLPEAGDTIRSHLSGCARCQDRLDAMRSFRSGVAVPPLPIIPALRASSVRTRQRWAMPAVTVLAVAASLGLFINRGWHQSGQSDSDTVSSRTKGSSRLGFYVKRGEQIQKGAPADILHPGDNIEFVYRAPSPGYLAIFSVDGQGKATVYYPTSPTAAAVQAGERVLPQSTLLDGVLGKETVYALFCTNAEQLEPIRAALETGSGTPPEVPGCTVETLHFEKR